MLYNKFHAIYTRIKKYILNRRESHLIQNNRGRTVEVSVSDLLYCNSLNGELLRYDIIVRYLAVSEYQKGSEKGFELYRIMQDKRMGAGYSQRAEKNFKDLIHSYDVSGYDKNSRILLDRNLGLIDGSHRIALALYYGYHNISALVIDSDHPVSYSIDWFVENGFSPEQLEWILNSERDIMKLLETPFSCVIWAPAVSMEDRIIQDLSCFGTICNTKRYRYRREEYKNIVRAIYSVDDIEKWKIEKKLEYMEGYEPEIVCVDLLLQNPSYRLKANTGLPLSTVGERIKRAIRSKYKTEIDNYFFDIILHIGDNIYQSSYMRDVVNSKFDIVSISRINYLEELDGILKRLNVKKEDVCLSGSEILAAEGIRPNHDLDIIIRPEALKKLNLDCPSKFRWKINISENIELYKNHLFFIGISDADIFNRKWYAEYEGYKIIPLQVVYLLKKSIGRCKDITDIAKIEEKFPNIKEDCKKYRQRSYKIMMMKLLYKLGI